MKESITSNENNIVIDRRLTSTYKKFFKELADKDRYRTYSVADFYCDKHGKPDPGKVNVIIRIDVDNGLHLAVPLAKALKAFGINSTYYFLTFQERCYRIMGSGIPKKVREYGHEVGLHSDHYYEQLVNGIDGIKQLKEDISKLSKEICAPIRGMVFHGHSGIDALGTTNWELTKNIAPEDIGLDYHDGLKSCYIKKGASQWEPPCDTQLSDYFCFPDSWGWNYYPNYPLLFLKKAQTGQILHIVFHVKGAFQYWLDWTEKYGEETCEKEPLYIFWHKALIIRIWFGLFRNKRKKVFIFFIDYFSYILAKGIGALWPKPGQPEMDTSWESGKKLIFQYGIHYWRQHLEDLEITAQGGTVLEIGSGDGQWLLAYAQDARKVIGIEPDKTFRECSRKTVSQYPDLAKKIVILDGVAERLPLKDESVDVILCAGVFMFTQQELALKEMFRVLKPESKVCLTVNGLGYFLMYVLNGFRYKSVTKMRYGIIGLISTCVKWVLKREISGPKAVSKAEMSLRLHDCGLELIDTQIWLDVALYPYKHLGFVTNYAFIAKKVE